ncbi:response regulator transcription factor [Collinsella sp. AM13-34]|uniref:response regulator transcription factor n=1 Tax=Collinsella sp. AM13-34 TaxID=2292024 RepID=UPI001F4124A2|nr:response regulator transcription factor [Collinsella sp. AM13-34]
MATNSGIAGAAASVRIPVMIVDDQPETRLGLALMVRRDPGLAIVLEAEDGRQAIDRIERAEELGRDLPRVVLMDVRMPVLDGIDATAAITRRWPNVYVLMLTTYDEDDYAFGGLEAGASGFLLKDVRAGELCRAVRSVADGDAVLTPRVTREVLARSVRASGQDKRAAELRSAFRRLTDREREVCALVADGLSNAEIAERLTVQPASAKRAVTRILAKLGLRDRTQIAVKWYQAGLLGGA